MSSNIKFKINGKTVTAEEFRRHKIKGYVPPPSGSASYAAPTFSDQKPQKSMSLGCHFKEIDMLNKTLHDHGIVGVNYVNGKRGGECVITNNSRTTGRRKWAKLYGQMVGVGPMRDNDGYD